MGRWEVEKEELDLVSVVKGGDGYAMDSAVSVFTLFGPVLDVAPVACGLHRGCSLRGGVMCGVEGVTFEDAEYLSRELGIRCRVV